MLRDTNDLDSVFTAESVNEEVDRIESILKSERAKMACTCW